MNWLLPTPSLLSRQQAQPATHRKITKIANLLTGAGEGCGRSQIIRQRESLVLYNVFNTLCFKQYRGIVWFRFAASLLRQICPLDSTLFKEIHRVNKHHSCTYRNTSCPANVSYYKTQGHLMIVLGLFLPRIDFLPFCLPSVSGCTTKHPITKRLVTNV